MIVPEPDTKDPYWNLVWSPKGNHLAYLAGDIGSLHRLDVVNVDDRTVKTVLETSAGESIGVPSFAPDGATMVYRKTGIGSAPAGIFVINVDGSGERQLYSSSDVAVDADPVFTPDGKSVLFVGTGATAETTGVYRTGLDGGQAEVVVAARALGVRVAAR
jgi:TolB protein